MKRAAKLLHKSRGALLTAGIGPPFADLAELRASYEEARRALRHATGVRPFIAGLDDVGLFDELTVSAGRTVAELVPDRTRLALQDAGLRAMLEAFPAANLRVSEVAQAIDVHPNTLRYRLRRVAERTGRDPHVLADLFELIASARVLSALDRAGLDSSKPHDGDRQRQRQRQPSGARQTGASSLSQATRRGNRAAVRELSPPSQQR